MSNWILTTEVPHREILAREELPDHENVVGFIYRITNLLTSRIYIGKKSLAFKTKKKASQKEKAAALARNPRSRITVVRGTRPSDWLRYWGSSDELKADVKQHGAQHFRREILELCCTKKYLNYAELEHLVKNDVLRRDAYNGNIAGKFYHRDMANCFQPPALAEAA